MILFKEKREAVRKVREEERLRAHEERLALQAEMEKICDKRIEQVKKQKDDERKTALKEKDAVIALLEEIIRNKNTAFNQFRQDIENLEILVTEISALGMGIENLTMGITTKFHNFKTRVSLITHSVEKKEAKYREILTIK